MRMATSSPLLEIVEEEPTIECIDTSRVVLPLLSDREDSKLCLSHENESSSESLSALKIISSKNEEALKIIRSKNEDAAEYEIIEHDLKQIETLE